MKYRNVKELQRLKLLEINEEYLNDSFLNATLREELFQNITRKLLVETDYSVLKFEINEETLQVKLCEVAAAILEYNGSLITNPKELETIACLIGVNLSGDYSNEEFFGNIVQLLKAKTKNGRACFEKLCVSGVFKNFNEGKKIPEILVFDGKTQPIFDYNESVYEEVFVETPLDTDRDGKRDLILTYIRRPLETNFGMKVPVVYIANPYMMGCNDDLYKGHNVDLDLDVFEETDVKYEDIKYCEEEMILPAPRVVKGKSKAIPAEDFDFECITPWYNYFLVRGYAVVFAGGIGTLRSEGIRSCGSVEETISTISVVDWLNGKIKAFSNKTDDFEVEPFWCTGKVGMTGKSYLGSLAIAAATTGVEGLKTIVPVASISNWYEYYRCNGLNLPAIGWQGDDLDLLAEHTFSRLLDEEDAKGIKAYFYNEFNVLRESQDRKSGNYNKFWDERNYINKASNIKSSVFIVHGLKDFNVKSKQFDMLWEALLENNIPSKMILHQGAHLDINNLKGIEYNEIMNKWFGHWLYDIDNKVMEDTPNVIIQNNSDINKWDSSETWPFEGVKEVKLQVAGGKLVRFKSQIQDQGNKQLTKIVDDISLTGYDREKSDDAIWVNSLLSNPNVAKPFRMTSVTDALNEDTRISGTVTIEMTAQFSENTGILSAMLVDYGTKKRAIEELEVIEKDAFMSGINMAPENLVSFKTEKKETDFAVITRGWISAQNRRNNYNKDEVVIGQAYKYQFDMQPIDYTLPKGHKLGLVIYSTDVQATQRQLKVVELGVDVDSVVVKMMVM